LKHVPRGALALFDAVGKELRLKLEKQKLTAPALVIDRISRML
jgi:uncharacterized protein (TIGR03435 family)